jgi:hypothetical protein
VFCAKAIFYWCSSDLRYHRYGRKSNFATESLEIWRRPSLACMRGMAEWELRAWLLGILSRAQYSDPSVGFVRFSRPFLWHEAVETVRILMRRTSSAVGGDQETNADLRRFFNQYLIRLGSYTNPSFPGHAPHA